MNIKECFEKRLLKRGRPDLLKSERALEISKRNLGKSESLMKHGFYSEAILAAYTAMFQSARALLFRDGIFERSHYCVVEYLKENYVKKHLLPNEYLYVIDAYRTQRHEVLYGLEEISLFPSYPFVEKKGMIKEIRENTERLVENQTLKFKTRPYSEPLFSLLE